MNTTRSVHTHRSDIDRRRRKHGSDDLAGMLEDFESYIFRRAVVPTKMGGSGTASFKL
jgi:hypothetical protein